MKRLGIPFLGVIALILLFLKMPETPDILDLFKCKTCSLRDPYLPLIGAAYFSLLIFISLLFPSFPKKPLAKGGLVGSIILGLGLTYLSFPRICVICLIAHLCNIFIWLIWVIAPVGKKNSGGSVREKFLLLFIAPICVVSLFAALNLTFMAYSPADQRVTDLNIGDPVPPINEILLQGALINFVSSNCPYCERQLPILNEVAKELKVIGVTPSLTQEMREKFPNIEWIEDKDSKLRSSFTVRGFPTLFIIDARGKIKEVIPGLPQNLKTHLLEQKQRE